MVTGLFPDRESAERAYGSLRERGYADEDVNLIMSDETQRNISQSTIVKLNLAIKHLKALAQARQLVVQLERRWPQLRRSELRSHYQDSGYSLLVQSQQH